MKPSTVLKKARKLIERGWTNAGYSVDGRGRELTNRRDPRVARVCNACALHLVGAGDRGKDPTGAWQFLERANPGALIITNGEPENSKRKSIGYFTRAIALAEKEGR